MDPKKFLLKKSEKTAQLQSNIKINNIINQVGEELKKIDKL